MLHTSIRKPWITGASAMLAVLLGLSACSGGETKPADDASAKPEATVEESANTEATAEESAKPEATAEESASGYGEEGEMTEGEKRNEEFQNKVSDEELLKGLQAGGYVVFVRHGQTNKDWADQASPDIDMENCATQRSLSEKGWKQAREIGAAFAKANIPVGDVTSSEYCRAWQTADLAFGTYKKDAALNFAKAEEYTEEQVKQMADGITPYLTTKPAAGMNNIVVGHDDATPRRRAFPTSWFPRATSLS